MGQQGRLEVVEVGARRAPAHEAALQVRVGLVDGGAPTVDDEGREIALAGTGSGLFLSRNGGRAWKPVFIGDAGTDVEQIAIVEPAVIWAVSHARGLLQSVDGGMHWQAVASFPEPSASAVAVIRQEESELAVAVVSEQEVFFSTDGGRVWEPAGTLPGPVMALLALETGPRLINITSFNYARTAAGISLELSLELLGKK